MLVNPKATILECQHAYARFRQAVMTSSDPDAVEAKKLVEDQYYPPIRRYNEIISILKHLPDENGDLALELPAPSYFFERAQTELFEMIQYLNIVISRYLASA